MIEVRERELKYDYTDRTALPSLDDGELGDTTRVVRAPPIGLDAIYFDTTDHRLLRSGMTLRRRTGGNDAGWHLKIPTSRAATRTEVRLPLERSDPAEVPDELVDLVVARTRGAELRPVANVKTKRSVSTVLDQHGQPLVEIAFDHVRAEALGPTEHSSREWREVEVEIERDGERIGRRVDAMLLRSGMRRAAAANKLTALFGDEPAGIPAHDAKDPIRSRLASLTEELLGRDVDVRRGADDAVHDLRVAVRRLRSCLRTFEPLFDSRRSRPLADELHWIAGELGAVRDLEVQMRHLTRSSRDHLDRARQRGVIDALDLLGSELTTARTSLTTAMRSRRYTTLLDELDAFAREPAYASGKRPPRSALLRQARRETNRVRRRLRTARRHSGNERDVRLHGARKTAKRARYAAETIAPLARRRARRVIRRYEALQELLGSRHDAVVAEQLLARVSVESSDVSSEVAFSLGMLAAKEDRRVRTIDRRIGRRPPRVPKL